MVFAGQALSHSDLLIMLKRSVTTLMNRSPTQGLKHTKQHTFISSTKMTSIASHLNQNYLYLISIYKPPKNK